MIGFCLQYRNRMDSYVALQIAQLADNLGFGCSIFADGPIQQNVMPRFDTKVNSDVDFDFRKWAKQCTHIVVTDSCHHRYLEMAKAVKVPTTLLVDWDRPLTSRMRSARLATNIACLSWHLSQLLHDRWRLKTIRHIPWDPCLPVIRRGPEQIRPRLLIPVTRKSASLSLADLTYLGCRLITNIPDSVVTFLHQTALPRSFKRRLTQTSLASGGRLRVAHATSWNDLITLFLKHDVTVQLDVKAGQSATSLLTTSLAMGVPVVGFDTITTQEFVTHQKTGVIAPCHRIWRDRSWGPETLPDVCALETALVNLFMQKNSLRRMKRHAVESAQGRQYLSTMRWQQLWSD